MRRIARSMGVVLAVSVGCKPPAPPPPPATHAATDAGSTANPGVLPEIPVPTTPVSPPDRAIATIRGAALRKVLNLVAAGIPSGVALGQVAPGLTPGIGERGIDVDPDATFAAVMMAPENVVEHGTLGLVVAWPLRSGMQVAQDAAAHRGYRDVSPGIYEPTNSDAGAGSASPCWIARRAPVGWMMLCGPRDSLRAAAPYLVWASSSAPAAGTVVDMTVRPEPGRQIFALQLAALEAQNPRVHPVDAGVPQAVIQAEYDEAHRGLENTKGLADDLASFHAVLTADENSYHLHAEADFDHGTGSSTRALLGSSVGHHAAMDLLDTFPASTPAWLAMGFDMHALSTLLVPNVPDPRLTQVLGPELGRLQAGVRNVADFRASGDRAVAITNDDGGTTIQVARMPDATGALANIRTLVASVPHSARPSGANPGDYVALMPTPGLPPGSLRLRLGPDPAHLPPGSPPEQRRMLSRTVLFVPQGDKLTIIEAGDPIARFRALSVGDRLHATGANDQVMAIHLTPAALGSLIGVPEQPDSPLSADAITGTLSSARRGDDGGHFVAQVDAPVPAVNQVRDLYLRLQQAAAQAEAQQRQAAAAAQRGAAGGAGAHGPHGTGGLIAPAPAVPDELPDPNFQLHAPQ